jgi:hypothetical protein
VLALPGFVAFDGIFPGSAGRGRIEGGAVDGDGRIALATLYAALTADLCLDLLRSRKRVVIDGGFTADPAFARLVAALRPGQEVLVNADGSGTAQGAALLWTHANRQLPVQLDLAPALPLTLPNLPTYRATWRQTVQNRLHRPPQAP